MSVTGLLPTGLSGIKKKKIEIAPNRRHFRRNSESVIEEDLQLQNPYGIVVKSAEIAVIFGDLSIRRKRGKRRGNSRRRLEAVTRRKASEVPPPSPIFSTPCSHGDRGKEMRKKINGQKGRTRVSRRDNEKVTKKKKGERAIFLLYRK